MSRFDLSFDTAIHYLFKYYWLNVSTDKIKGVSRALDDTSGLMKLISFFDILKVPLQCFAVENLRNIEQSVLPALYTKSIQGHKSDFLVLEKTRKEFVFVRSIGGALERISYDDLSSLNGGYLISTPSKLPLLFAAMTLEGFSIYKTFGLLYSICPLAMSLWFMTILGTLGYFVLAFWFSISLELWVFQFGILLTVMAYSTNIWIARYVTRYIQASDLASRYSQRDLNELFFLEPLKPTDVQAKFLQKVFLTFLNFFILLFLAVWWFPSKPLYLALSLFTLFAFQYISKKIHFLFKSEFALSVRLQKLKLFAGSVWHDIRLFGKETHFKNAFQHLTREKANIINSIAFETSRTVRLCVLPLGIVYLVDMFLAIRDVFALITGAVLILIASVVVYSFVSAMKIFYRALYLNDVGRYPIFVAAQYSENERKFYKCRLKDMVVQGDPIANILLLPFVTSPPEISDVLEIRSRIVSETVRNMITSAWKGNRNSFGHIEVFAIIIARLIYHQVGRGDFDLKGCELADAEFVVLGSIVEESKTQIVITYKK